MPRSTVGIQGVTIRFPWTPYNGFNTEQGYNAILMGSIINSWIQDVKIVNAGELEQWAYLVNGDVGCAKP